MAPTESEVARQILDAYTKNAQQWVPKVAKAGAIMPPEHAAIGAAILNYETSKKVEAQTRILVWLTVGLFAASIALAALTIVLIWRTYAT